MIASWLGPALEEFQRTVLGKQAFAQPGTAKQVIPYFGWDTLDRVLRDKPDALVVGNGALEDRPVPHTLEQAQLCLRAGQSVVVRRAERHDPGLAELAQAFARDLPGQVHLQLFVTPPQRRSFGWHFDAEEVFIVQTHGSKAYYFRENTVSPHPRAPVSPRELELSSGPSGAGFAAFREETSPMMSATLLPGDWLHLPSPWWHIAQALEGPPSLSISIGLVPK